MMTATKTGHDITQYTDFQPFLCHRKNAKELQTCWWLLKFLPTAYSEYGEHAEHKNFQDDKAVVVS